MTYQGITGTFLDEITHDIASQNWGAEDWAREFDTFVTGGIDTVIMIRTGYAEKLACPSRVLAARCQTLPVYVDLVRPFLDLAAERDITLYFGLYDSGHYWQQRLDR